METADGFFFSEEFCLYRNIAAIVGLLYIGRIVFQLLWGVAGGVYSFFLAPWGIARENLQKYGSWAVITGASEGIGRGYALELARQGLNVVIMSRSQEKLQRLADEIRKNFHREVLIIAMDFLGGMEIYQKLAEKLKSLDIGILVNNVGLSYEYPEVLCNAPPERMYDIVKLNCQPVVQMSCLILPHMVERKHGLIINVSSASSLVAAPTLAVYSATKIFVNYMSDGIRKEVGSSGIMVQNVMPFFVATSMAGVKKTSFTIPSPVNYTRAAVATIGIQKNTFGCFSHAVQGFIFNRLFEFLVDKMAWKLSKFAKARYLRYCERKS